MYLSNSIIICILIKLHPETITCLSGGVELLDTATLESHLYFISTSFPDLIKFIEMRTPLAEEMLSSNRLPTSNTKYRITVKLSVITFYLFAWIGGIFYQSC